MDLVFDDTHEYFLMDDYTINTGNSVIYRANDKKLNRDVAIKKISVTNELALKQAKHEIQVLSKFSNGEVPYIYDYHVQDENLYIIMQWIQGDSLEKKLKRKQVSLKEMTGWMMELCDTLDELALSDMYSSLEAIGKLQSGSDFVDISPKEYFDEIPDDSYADMAAEKLITELDRLFTDCQQSVKRAVMAAVLSMLPVFFNNTEEIQDYINSSLIQCSDEAEKKAVVEVVRMIIAGQ